jgi:hypothetical protein
MIVGKRYRIGAGSCKIHQEGDVREGRGIEIEQCAEVRAMTNQGRNAVVANNKGRRDIRVPI